VRNSVKLSSPETREFWEIPILFEDEHLLALNKPPLLRLSPDRADPRLPSLIGLLHRGIQRGAPWAAERHLQYLMHAHRLDSEISGVLMLARSKPVLVALANLFGSARVTFRYLVLVQGHPAQDSGVIEAKLAPASSREIPAVAGAALLRVDQRKGKRSKTEFEVRERFARHTLLECRPSTHRPHQIRAHLSHLGFPVAGDPAYGGSDLLLSQLKPGYRLKPKKTERPLISTPAIYAEELILPHPVTGAALKIAAPCPKDLAVALKYLRRYALS
jgi:RluA family pseudouridine synthase